MKPKPWMAHALLCAITLVAYINSFGLGFALDGRGKVLTDTRVQAATAQDVGLILTKHYWWPHPTDRLYRPVTLLSFLFNYAVLGNGANPAGYHILNLLLHMLNVCLLFELALLVLGSREWAIFAAGLWAVHPVQTEAVANVAGRADLLCAAAVFGGLLLYIRSIELTGVRKWYRLAALFTVALAGMFSKENAVVLPGLMVLWDLSFGWHRKAGWRPRQAAYLLMAAALCVFAAVRWKIFEGEPWPESPFLDNPIRAAGFLPGRLTAIAVIGRYLGMLVWPARLSFDYAYAQIPTVSLSEIAPWLVLLLLTGILVTVVARYRADRTLFWAAGFFGIALLPTANLVFPIGAIMAVRFLYLPSAGFALAMSALAMRLNRPLIARCLLGIAIAALAARTVGRNPAWQDDEALGKAGVAAAPNSFRTHQILAQALYGKDHTKNLDEAIREYETSYRLTESLPPERRCTQCLSELGMFYYSKANALGGAATGQGRAWFEKALAMLENARTVSAVRAAAFNDAQVAHGLPVRHVYYGEPSMYLYLARTYSRLGRADDALRTYRELQGQDPTNHELYDEMATIYASHGQLEQAAIVIDEKAFVLGVSRATEASLRNLYARIPDGGCALTTENGAAALNLNCMRVRADMCLGWAELDAAYRAAGQLQRAESLRTSAIERYACPAEPFAAGR